MNIRAYCIVACLAVAPPAAAAAQNVGEVRQMFESGQHQFVVQAAGPEAPPEVVFMAALSQQKLGAVDQAIAQARRLAALPDSSAWHFIGQSVVHLLEDRTDEALDAARRAVALDGGLVEAQVQLGLVLARREAWKEAADAFDKAASADPAYAYAYYYGGLMHHRAGRTDLMAARFERFLKLAPEAPERPEVLQIMRTIRGR